ncbi:hypothetical protein ACHAXA_002764 [Cyclostephanos tholiformis]|uniref:Uncharacterized protein n=1 Tax=Cyclostephanos tholiformis TaxID=382380 RepID=A0ABD3RF42_9STRA
MAPPLLTPCAGREPSDLRSLSSGRNVWGDAVSSGHNNQPNVGVLNGDDIADYPDLAPSDPESENENDDNDRCPNRSTIDLVRAFREPLFPNDPSRPLAIAYSHLNAAMEERRRIKARKRKALRELKDLREKFMSRKRELLDLNATLGTSSKRVSSWTRRVFDLELKEPGCPWNAKLHRLREYVERHGKFPEHVLKVRGTDEERVLAAFVSKERSKAKASHRSFVKYPHRFRALEELGVTWESDNDARFEVMFTKLLEYRREHGTFRMPSLELCKESGDEDLILLHNWVFSQIGGFRYQLRTKKVEVVKRFLDVGFSFERWYGTNGHVFDRDIPPFDSICRRYVNNGGKLDENDMEILRVANENQLKRGKRRGKNARAEGGTETREEAASEEAVRPNSTAINAAVGHAIVKINLEVDDESAPGEKNGHEVDDAYAPERAECHGATADAVVDNFDDVTAFPAPAIAPVDFET